MGARPLTPAEWDGLLEDEGFEVRVEAMAPMALLELGRLVQDEGILGALHFVGNVLRDAGAHKGVLAMRDVFGTYRKHLAAIALVAAKR